MGGAAALESRIIGVAPPIRARRVRAEVRVGAVGLALFLASVTAATALEPAGAEHGVPVLTLEEAISSALSGNRVLASSTLDVARARERVAVAKSQRWPTLSVTLLESRLLTRIDFEFEKGIFGTYPGIGPIPAEDTRVGTPRGFTTLGLGQLQLPLSQQYKIGLNIRLSELSGDSAQEALRAQRQDTVNQVRKAYYGVLQAESALAAVEESLSLAREVERVVGERFRAQKALEVDQIEARARLTRTDADALAARNALAVVKERLNHLLGRDIGTDFRVAPVVPPLPYPGDLTTARSRALELSPTLRQARLQASQAEFSWKLSKAELLPDLGFEASYISPYSVDFLPRNIYSVGFLFQWDIFDGGRRRHEAAEKRKALEQARLALAERESSVLLDVGQQYRSVEEKRRGLSAAELERSARRERLRIAKDQYQAEMIIAGDLLRTQADLADADRQYILALTAFWAARADLERAVGQDAS